MSILTDLLTSGMLVEQFRDIDPEHPIVTAFSTKQAEAVLLALTRAQYLWNDFGAIIPDRPGYPIRLALDEAIEELKEAMK